jgi:hypothetical protein
VKTFLSENPQLMAEVDERVRAALQPAPVEETAGTDTLDPDDLPISLDN